MQLLKYYNKDVVTSRFCIKLISNDKNKLKTNFLMFINKDLQDYNCCKIHSFFNFKNCLNKEENKYIFLNFDEKKKEEFFAF